MSDRRETLLAVFGDARSLIEGVQAMVRGDKEILEALSPIPLPELEELLPGRPSFVRWFALMGCVGGGAFGLALQIGTVLQWPHLTGGKPALSLPAFVVVAFEMTILLGALATFAGLMIAAKLPQIGKDHYHDGCSQSDFALVVRCDQRERSSLETLLREAGAQEVRAVEPKSVWLRTDEE